MKLPSKSGVSIFDMKKAMDSGLSPVCATCTKYWEGMDKGLGACTGKACAGPIAGKDFPEYDGPMEQLDKYCFACTSHATMVIKPTEGTRLIGICDEHLQLIDRLRPENFASAGVEVYSSKGLVVPKMGRYTPKSLGEVMHENGDL